MSDEIESATPAEQEQPAEQVQQVESNSPEATTEQTQERQEQSQETQEEKAKKEPWFQKRIGELTREKYEARRAADEARQQADQYRQYLAQLQQGQQTEQSNQPPVDLDSLASQRAAQMLAEQRFNESCNKVYATGKSEFPDFDQAVANLQMVGVNRDFLELATSSDASAKLIHHLGTDLDEAARILALPPVQMARELTKLEFKLNQPPPPKPVSKAPPPISPVGVAGKAGAKSPAEMTDAEYAKWRKSARN